MALIKKAGTEMLAEAGEETGISTLRRRGESGFNSITL